MSLTVKFIVALNLFFAICDFALAARRDLFTGEAKEDGKLVYIEKHDVSFDDAGNVINAKTVYVDTNGKVLGTLESNFKQSLSMPEHLYVDGRTNGKYGIRRKGEKVILFYQDEGKDEVSKELESEDVKSRVQIGCQGFNYFLKDKIESIKNQKNLPILFVIPGDLSTYKFVLEFIKENAEDNTVEFKVKIENWFLRAFAPQLEFRYDKKINRIVWYKGISNIKNDKGKNMFVTIDYKY